MTPAVVITQDGRRIVFERDDSIVLEPATTASGNRVHAKSSGDNMTLCGWKWVDDQRSDLTVDCKMCLRSVELG